MAAHESLARILAIDDVVDGGEIGFAVAFAAFRRGVLPRAGLRALDPLRRCRVRRQKVLRARIDRGLACFQLGVAFHRGQEARGAIGIEMRARRNADADAVGLELLLPREARHRQLGLGERHRGEIGIVAHVGDDAGDDGGLARLVFADRGVLGQHMRHLVAQHRGQFRGVAGQRDQAARHIELAGRQREGVDRAGIEDRHLVGLVGTIGCRHQPVDGLADQGLELRIVIGAAIGRQDPFMLALGGRGLRDGACGGLAAVRRCPGTRSGTWPRSPQPASANAAHSTAGAAQRRRLIPSRAVPHTAATAQSLVFVVPRANSRPAVRSAPPGAPQFRWPATRLDPATDPNPSIFERLKHNSSRLERRHHALWNSHGKVPCPVPSEIQISRCPGLPNGQNLALDHINRPIPAKISPGLSAFFMAEGSAQAPRLACRAAASAAASAAAQSLSVTVAATSASPCASNRPCTEVSEPVEKHESGLTAVAVGGVVLALQA